MVRILICPFFLLPVSDRGLRKSKTFVEGSQSFLDVPGCCSHAMLAWAVVSLESLSEVMLNLSHR